MSGLLVVLGAALGGPARLWTDWFIQSRTGPPDGTRLPLGTLAVNLLGSFLLGLLLGLGVSQRWYLLLGVGFCGAFTTFSTFAAQTDAILSRGLAWSNVTANTIGCIAVAAAGYAVGSL